jgi:hypothetical protein
MKRILAIFVTVSAVVVGQAWSNDTHISFSAGAVGFYNAEKEDPHISLLKEVLTIEMTNEQVNYSVDYVFHNDSDDLQYDIGFPVLNNSFYKEQKAESERRISLMNFQTSVNDSPTSFEKIANSADPKISSWYVKRVKFAGNGDTRVKLSYASPYGYGSGFQNYVEYYYGSARTWKGDITSFKIVLTNHSNLVVRSFENPVIGHLPEITISGKDTTTFEYKNLKPDMDATVKFTAYDEKFMGYNWDQMVPELTGQRYSQDQLLLFRSSQLRILRNIIYALRGYRFKDPDLIKFFTDNAKLYNYNPQFDNVDSKFRWDEKDNIRLIASLEKTRLQN